MNIKNFKINPRNAFVLLCLCAFVILAFFGFRSQMETQQAEAASTGDVSGWAWSSNIGWISFSGEAQDGSLYGVNVDISTGGDFSGYAWANPHDDTAVPLTDNIGWISFNETSGCPQPPCPAKLNLQFDSEGNITGGTVTGWARALSGMDANDGWDGWISLSGKDLFGGNDYGVTYAPLFGGALTGWAWGDDVVGWVQFYDVSVSLDIGDTPLVSLVIDEPTCLLPTGGSVELSWSSSANVDSCSADWTDQIDSSGTETVDNVIPQHTFNISCVGPDGAATDSVTIYECEEPPPPDDIPDDIPDEIPDDWTSISLEASPSPVPNPLLSPGDNKTTLSWSADEESFIVPESCETGGTFGPWHDNPTLITFPGSKSNILVPIDGTVFTITCETLSGYSTSDSVIVKHQPLPPPVVTLEITDPDIEPPGPEVEDVSSPPNQVTLEWTTGGYIEICEATSNPVRDIQQYSQEDDWNTWSTWDEFNDPSVDTPSGFGLTSNQLNVASGTHPLYSVGYPVVLAIFCTRYDPDTGGPDPEATDWEFVTVMVDGKLPDNPNPTPPWWCPPGLFAPGTPYYIEY